MNPSQFLPSLISAVLLSTLGMPWLAFARSDRSGSKGTLRSRWVLFAWFHPVLAAMLRWSVVVVTVAATSSGFWYWRGCT